MRGPIMKVIIERRHLLGLLGAVGRVLPALLVLLGAAIVWTYRDAIDPPAIKAIIDQNRFIVIAFLAVHVVASLIFIPRIIVLIAAGLMFGIWWGFVWATIGTMLGSLAGFLVARHVNGGLFELERTPRLGPLLIRAERGGWRSVAIVRLVPAISHSAQNYLFGITRVKFWPFLFGSLVGHIPGTVNYVLIGGLGERILTGEVDLALLLIFVLSIAMGLTLFAICLRRCVAETCLGESEKRPKSYGAPYQSSVLLPNASHVAVTQEKSNHDCGPQAEHSGILRQQNDLNLTSGGNQC